MLRFLIQISKMVIWIILNIVISCAGLFISVWIWKRRTRDSDLDSGVKAKVASDSPSMNTRSRGEYMFCNSVFSNPPIISST